MSFSRNLFVAFGSISISAAILFLNGTANIAYGGAGDDGASATPADASAKPADVSADTQAIQGGVQKVQLSLEKLRDIGLDLKQVTTSARHLYDEVTIQPVSMITEPEVVGRGTIIYIPIGTQPVGPPKPPDPKRVTLAMNNMRPIINTLQENADDFVSQHKQLDVSPAAQEKMQPLVKKWVEAADNIAGQFKVLEPLAKGPDYDNAEIAKLCTNIQQDAYVLDKVRRDAYKIIKKEEKQKASGT